MALGCFNATQTGNAQPKQLVERYLSSEEVFQQLVNVLQSDPLRIYATPTASPPFVSCDLGYAFIDVVHGRSLTATG